MRIPNAAHLAASIAILLALAGDVRADHHTAKIANKEKVGSYLTDAKGMALYIFKKDSSGKSACAGPCVAKWPIYDVEQVGVSGKLDAKSFGTITREDGKKQTTYKGMPLYYFAGDKAPSDTTGHGLNEVWFLAQP
jgi:predicted lipoprotein with Yx(FWY)xxD motif